MPPGRKRASTSSKSSSSTHGLHSPVISLYDCGSVVWCKYKKYPYWPGIIWEKTNKPNRTLYEVLFFGTFSLGLAIDSKFLEPYEGVAEFKKRITELKANEILIKNKPSQYEMNITLANLESFQEAIKQASKVIKCSNSSERLTLADNMRKGVTCDFFQLEFEDNADDDEDGDDDDDIVEEDNEEIHSNLAEDNTSILSIPPIQNDQQFIQTMITQSRSKRKLDDDGTVANVKIRRITIKNEPEQPSNNPPPSVLFRHSNDQPLVMCSNFVCHSLSPTEETFILDAIKRSGSDCSFFEAKHIAEEMYSNIVCVNNSNRPLPVSEIWFYLFFYLHCEQLFSTHPHWLDDLENAKTNNNYLYEQQQQIIRLMKTYRR
ncbi:unnamed protein product [Adineta steineri]|uniref:PWWP domain-containing protein n=2 Tax=Adineta steineri TaxID=433720 RepID=A0A813VWS6_9BILA|nr:unnamed protein product [Adineta steineri]CAF0843266.1 unnamed protein product [Adineta steineri]CAF3604358.1 unnamed protein product [Adineta steineri]CAF3610556.1 unnamed protein product [Adineta steineri]